MLILGYCICLKHRFKRLSEKLHDSVKICLNNIRNTAIEDVKSPKVEEVTPDKIKNIRITFNKMSGIVKLFNRIFGWQLLLLFASTGITLLEIINLIIENSTTNRTLVDAFFLLSVFWVIFKVVSFQTKYF